MQNLFNSVKMFRPKNNVFDLSHDMKFTCNMGELIPIMCEEAVPGDKINISNEALIRFGPLVAPVMHRFDVTFHYFFVPNRLLWPNWEKFITSTDDSTAPAAPTVVLAPSGSGNAGEWSVGSLHDYIGNPDPQGVGLGIAINALPYAAYQMIYNEYYRDQNLVNPVPFELIDGDNGGNLELYIKRFRAWEHDYFTAALPFAQKGQAVDLPLGQFQDVPVHGWEPTDPGANAIVFDGAKVPGPGNSLQAVVNEESENPDIPDNTLYANTSDLMPQATTINDLRRAFRLQEWLEKAARGGSRYIESILAHFGVRSSDKRLQRPEYITGIKSPVVVTEVANTAGDALPQANLAGKGVSVTTGKHGTYFCEEHGFVMGIMSVMPKTAYMQGIPKKFLKLNNKEYYWPSFAHIGEQEVLNNEVYAIMGSSGTDTFGYVPRYAEYKFAQNRVAGEFRTSLDFWHAGRIFATQPNLNDVFIECKPDDRIFAVPGQQNILAHVYNKVRMVRPMPKFGTPTF